AEHVYDARKKLEELRETNVTPASSAAVIAGLASGSLDVLELDRPRAELRAKIEAVEQQLNAWQSARKVAEEAVPGRERAVEWSQRKLHDAAIAVLRESNAFAPLADDLDELQERVIEKRLALKFLWLHSAVPNDDKERVESLLNKFGMMPLANFTPAEFVNHPTTKQWESALVALMADADAALPTFGDQR
ncbi:MAG: hypothetical protein ACLP4V_30740, partial [Methylocella sp.]